MPALTTLIAAAPASPVLADGGDSSAAKVEPKELAPMDEDLAHLDTGLWHPEHQHRAWELHASLLQWRRVGSPQPKDTQGFEGGMGAAATVRPGPFVLSWGAGLTLRAFDSKSFALSYMQHVSGAIALGPVEPEIRVAFSIATVDVFHANWSAELLSPRAAIGAWLHLGGLRLGMHGFGEYLWRWLGDGNVLVHGLAFSLQIGS